MVDMTAALDLLPRTPAVEGDHIRFHFHGDTLTARVEWISVGGDYAVTLFLDGVTHRPLIDPLNVITVW